MDVKTEQLFKEIVTNQLSNAKTTFNEVLARKVNVAIENYKNNEFIVNKKD